MVHASALYADYLDSRFASKLVAAKKAVRAAVPDRLKTVEQLLGTAAKDADRKSLDVARSMFGPMDDASKLQYLIPTHTPHALRRVVP